MAASMCRYIVLKKKNDAVHIYCQKQDDADHVVFCVWRVVETTAETGGDAEHGVNAKERDWSNVKIKVQMGYSEQIHYGGVY